MTYASERDRCIHNVLPDESTLGFFLVWRVGVEFREHFCGVWIHSHGCDDRNPFLLRFSGYMFSLQHNEQQRSWEWHLLSLKAGRPKIKVTGLGLLCCIYRNQLEDKWWDSYSVGRHEKPSAHTTTHMRVYADTPLLHVQPQDKHITHRCMHTMEAESLITWLD